MLGEGMKVTDTLLGKEGTGQSTMRCEWGVSDLRGRESSLIKPLTFPLETVAVEYALSKEIAKNAI